MAFLRLITSALLLETIIAMLTTRRLQHLARRQITTRLAAMAMALAVLLYGTCAISTAQQIQGTETVGPLVGFVGDRTAHILYRPGETEGTLRLTVFTTDGKAMQSVDSIAQEKNDFVAKFVVQGLQPATSYQYQIEDAGTPGKRLVNPSELNAFTTADLARKGHTVTVAFVSCVESVPNPIWDEMGQLGIDTLCLMGDTPYIDQTELGIVRKKHREFLQIPGIASMVAKTPTVGTWDDHDFGLNNANGLSTMAGKLNTRRAFVEYRAHSQYGTGTEGVYHKIDLGMIEVFLLDPRYFSQTAKSPVDPSQPTCFGAEQWEWLLESLKASRAPFKVLAFGEIWQDKKNRETDDLFTYWYERDALLDFIKQEGISGVTLLGGDIHVARHLIHPQRIGYDLHDFIVSPGHDHVISRLNVYHPSLEWSLVEGNQFLTLTADGTTEPPLLTAQFWQPNGKINREVKIPLDKMMPEHSREEQSSLRASWSFSEDAENRSILGSRINATLHNQATLDKQSGQNRSAVRLTRESQSYISVPRSFLDDNSAAHSVSLWFKPSSLPRHASNDRYFLLESTAEGEPSAKQAWHLSLGLRPTESPEKINLQLYTVTLKPASQPEGAPEAVSQGPFDTVIDRTRVADRWNQVAFTFNSRELRLYLDGELLSSHLLPIPGPAAEWGGLVMGGHRAGVGRNFDGWLRDVTIWQEQLKDEEITQLFRVGKR
jgi:alkaline phosphatase D